MKTNSVTPKIGQSWNTCFEQNGTSSPLTAPLCGARARPPRLPGARLTALGGSTLPTLPGGGGRAIGRPATALGLGCSSYGRLQRPARGTASKAADSNGVGPSRLENDVGSVRRQPQEPHVKGARGAGGRQEPISVVAAKAGVCSPRSLVSNMPSCFLEKRDAANKTNCEKTLPTPPFIIVGFFANRSARARGKAKSETPPGERAVRRCAPRLRRRPVWPPMRWAALACAIGLVCRGDCYNPRGTVCLDSSFETDTADWRTWFTASKFTQWKRGQGSTPTSSTGPSQAKDQSFYWYVETNPWQIQGYWPYPSTWSNLPDDATNLESPMVSGASDLSFYYHMYGSGIGTLEVGCPLRPAASLPVPSTSSTKCGGAGNA